MPETLDSFRIAQEELDEAAGIMGLDKQAHAILREPLRTMIVNIPVRMRDGSVKTFKGFRVHHNDARGPCKGGIRYHPKENLDMVKALATWMTWKASLANIPYGGAKGGVICDTKKLNTTEIENLSRDYVRALRNFIGSNVDIPAPDVYTNPQIMAWMMDEYSKLVGHNDFGVITGKPIELWGSEGRFDATARGGMYVLRNTAKLLKLDLKKARIAIQGFGNAGMFAFDLSKKLFGSRIVAISDSTGGIYVEKGIDYNKLLEAKNKTGTVQGYAGAEKITNEKLLQLDVDVLIPAAIENQITEHNADKIKTKILLELANGPVTPKADAILFEKGVIDMPDFLVNAGGVIVSYFEWVQNTNNFYWCCEDVYTRLDNIISKSFQSVIQTQRDYASKKKKISLRMSAYIIAVSRVAAAMKARGWY